MKKLALVIVFFASTGMLMAQHTDVVYQEGDQNISNVFQDTYFEDPITPGYPSPIGNVAYVDQIGNVNVSRVIQDNNGYAGATNFADVDQIGNYNGADVWQNNFGHIARIYSLGNRNDAFITQDGNLNWGLITQIGNDNFGLIRTNGLLNSSEIYQAGNFNESWQYMGGVGNGTNVDYNQFYATQSGIGNYAFQELQGNDWAGGVTEVHNIGTIVQDGNYNGSTQLIYFGFGNMHDNILFSNQLGNYNASNQFVKGSLNTSTHTAIGDNNIENTFQNW